MKLKLSDFNYILPPQLIARYPLPNRSASRLLFLNRQTGAVSHLKFTDLPDLLSSKDLLILNNTKVIPARLLGRKKTGGKIEILVERILSSKNILAHVRGGGSIKIGHEIFLDHQVIFEMIGRRGELFELQCMTHASIDEVLDQIGELPIPPYFERSPNINDLTRYQTIFSEKKGSIAAPTAGLHFDEEIFQRLSQKNIQTSYLTLHVGSGTFLPVRCEDIRQHTMHTEYFEVSEKNCEAIKMAQKKQGKIIAVGTTVCRSLETVALKSECKAYQGETDIFIYPGFEFKCVNGLLTNFHLPGSTLLMLVSAFAGYENIFRAYQLAIENKYRFFSYGDAMLIL